MELKRQRKIFSEGFWLGVLLITMLKLTFEDWMGHEGYVRYVQEHWWYCPWWVWPLAFIVFLLCRPRFVWDILFGEEKLEEAEED